MDVWVTQVGAGQFYNLTRGRSPSSSTLGAHARLLTGRHAGDVLGRAGPGDRATSASGPSPCSADSPAPTWKAWPNSTGRPTVPARLSHPGRGRSDLRAGGGPAGPGQPVFTRGGGLHSPLPRLVARTATSSTSCRERCPIAWTSGAWTRAGNPGADDAAQLSVEPPRLPGPPTLLYLASDTDGSGPWMHSLDVERRMPRRLGTASTSTLRWRRAPTAGASWPPSREPKGTLWRLPMAGRAPRCRPARRIPLTTGNGSFPTAWRRLPALRLLERWGDSIWKLQGDTTTELWSAPEARIIGGPASRAMTAARCLFGQAADRRCCTCGMPTARTPGW